MELTDDELRFVAKRAWFVKKWRYVGITLLAMLAGLGGWLFLSVPLLANPCIVLARLNDGSIPESTMDLMAMLLPVVFLFCIFLAVIVILFAFAVFSNEKKYLEIIQRELHKRTIAQHKAPADADKPR